MNIRKVFIEDLECFGEVIDFALTLSDNHEFLDLCSNETLERLLDTQILRENYMMAELIKNKIEFRKNKTM